MNCPYADSNTTKGATWHDSRGFASALARAKVRLNGWRAFGSQTRTGGATAAGPI
jgi:hypothetical protein